MPCGLTTPPLAFGPITEGNFDGCTLLATRLNALMHWSTCAGSFCSNRSTVRKTSCGCRLRGGAWQARRKCEIFSICTNGILDGLYLTPGGGIATLMSLLHVVSHYATRTEMKEVEVILTCTARHHPSMLRADHRLIMALQGHPQSIGAPHLRPAGYICRGASCEGPYPRTLLTPW